MGKYKVVLTGQGYVTQSFVVHATDIIDAIKRGEQAYKNRMKTKVAGEVLSVTKGNYI
jgi:hypothetical protein